MEADPSKRITWNEYFNHPFFILRKNFKEDYKNKYKTIKKIGIGNNTDVYIVEKKKIKNLEP